jgi:tRNA(Ile)-lysidine synthase
MIHILGKIPRTVAVAVSGGIDSMAVLDFLRRGKRDITVLHYNHSTPFAGAAEGLVREYCRTYALPLLTEKNEAEAPSGASMENFWRKQRYSFFAKVNLPIITCHHLDDAVESWVFTSMHGNPFLIPHKRDNFIRPFLITEKSELSYWAITKNVPYISDPSNNETKYQRNYIRHKMMPHVLRINPGIKKTIKKKYLNLETQNA